jgi:hypothetical protein
LETVNNTSPATTWTSTGSPNPSGQVSAPTFTEMALSNYLQTNFNYTTGPFENYDSNNISKKFLTRLDWNINDNNQLARYVSQLKC